MLTVIIKNMTVYVATIHLLYVNHFFMVIYKPLYK